MNNKKAFSLFELVMVLAILAIIMGLGWTGLINFRSTTELQNAYSELVSVIKTQQNKAKNSVSSNQDGSTPFFYALFFSNNKYYAFNCGKPTAGSSSVNCKKDSTVTFRVLPIDIKINPDAKCTGIGFEILNGKFVSFPTTNSNLDTVNSFDTTYEETGSCSIGLSHTQITNQKSIQINLDLNSIEVK